MENWPYDSPGRLYDIIAAMKIQRQELMVDWSIPVSGNGQGKQNKNDRTTWFKFEVNWEARFTS